MSGAAAVCRYVVVRRCRQVVAASRFPAVSEVSEAAGAPPPVFTHRRQITPFVVRESCFSTYKVSGGDRKGRKNLDGTKKELERLRTSVARLEVDVYKRNDSINLVEEALRNVYDDGWFTPERAPQLAYLEDLPPKERQTLLMDVLKEEKEDLRRKEEDLRRKEEDLRRKEEDLRRKEEDLRRKENLGTRGTVQKEPDSEHSIPWGAADVNNFDFSDPGSFKKAGEDCRYFLVDEDTMSLGGGNWRRRYDLDDYANQLVTYSRLVSKLDQDLSMGNEIGKKRELKEGDCTVEHLGHSVIVEKLTTNALESDARKNPQVVIRKGTRKLIKEVISSLTVLDFRGALVIGHPGTGKTRSGMMLMLQQLLEKGAAVVRLGYKEESAYAFIPKADGQGYQVWAAVDINPIQPFSDGITSDPRMIVLVDPPEQGDYKWALRARTVKFCSNNEEKHYKNADKDPWAFFYTDMPTRFEMETMTPLLWSEKSESPGSLTTTRDQEVTRRCRVVGCAPRHVFDFERFKERAEAIAAASDDLFDEFSLTALAEGLYRTTKPTLVKRKVKSSVPSRIYFLDSPDMKSPVLEMNPSFEALTYLSLTRELSSKKECDAKDFENLVGVKLRAGGSFEVCSALEGSMGGRFTTKEFEKRGFASLPTGGLNVSGMRELIQKLDGTTVLSTKSVRNYPVVDFALSPTEWVNAKSGEVKLKYSTLEREMKKSNISSLTLYLAVRDKEQIKHSIFPTVLSAEEESAKEFLDEKLTLQYLICFPKLENITVFTLEDYDAWERYDELDILSRGVYMKQLYENYDIPAPFRLEGNGKRDN